MAHIRWIKRTWHSTSTFFCIQCLLILQNIQTIITLYVKVIVKLNANCTYDITMTCINKWDINLSVEIQHQICLIFVQTIQLKCQQNLRALAKIKIIENRCRRKHFISNHLCFKSDIWRINKCLLPSLPTTTSMEWNRTKISTEKVRKIPFKLQEWWSSNSIGSSPL